MVVENIILYIKILHGVAQHCHKMLTLQSIELTDKKHNLKN